MASISSRLKLPVHIEVEQTKRCSLSKEEVSKVVAKYLSEHCPLFSNGIINHTLTEVVKSMEVCDLQPNQTVSFWQADLRIYVYRLKEQGPESDYFDDGNDDSEALPIAEQYELPNITLKGLWNSIVIDEHIKTKLVNYATTSIKFAQMNVDQTIISWNKMVLLYGPPGIFCILL